MSEQSRTSTSVVRGVRRAAIIAIIGSLVVAAGLGIVALLSGDFGETQAKVLLTTLTVAAFGTTALCHLATVSRDVRVVGYLGIAGSLVAAGCAFALIWTSAWDSSSEWLWKGLGVGAVAAVSLAQANLLLLLAGRAHRVIRVTLWATLAAVAVVALMIIVPILTDGRIPGEGAEEPYWRIFGVVAILDALGTIALPILALVLRRAEPASVEVAESGPLSVTLPPYVADLVRTGAAREGRTPEDFAAWVLQAALNPPAGAPAPRD